VTDKTADQKAFEAELIALIPHLRAFGRSLTGNVAQGEDLAQDALAKALAHRENFEMGTNMKAWAFMILRNQFYSDKRRAWRSAELDPEVAERTLVSKEGPADGMELDELRRALAMLPDDQREALILIGAAGLSYEDVSQIVGVPMGTIKSRVSRARDHLALIYAEGRIAADHLPPRAAMDAIFAQIAQLQRGRAAA
jgi:RNA polymerase sigma-70 factor (ECF subfamily)